jgi:hypothetical protein
MYRIVLFIGVCSLFGLGTAAAQSEPAPAEPAPAKAAPSAGAVRAPAPAPEQAKRPDPRINKAGRAASSPRRGKGSGFWTSDVPAQGNKYRYGMMGVGALVFILMGLFVIHLLRKHGGTGPPAGTK